MILSQRHLCLSRTDQRKIILAGVTDPSFVSFTDDVKYVTRPYTALNYTLLGVGGAIILTIVLSLCAIIGIRNRDRIASLFINEDV